MSIRSVFWLCFPAVLVGCETTQPPQAAPPVLQAPAVTYVAPEPSALAAETFVLDAPVPDALAQIVDALNGPRFGITHLDERTGLLTASYSGDPSPYVECGKLILESSRGQVREVPGAVRNLRYEVPIGPSIEKIGVVTRDLTLDGYLIVRVSPGSAQTSQVSVSANYVLTRTNELEQSGESGRLADRSYVSFSTGENSQFADGGATRCQPNGEFEAAVARIGTTTDPGLAQVRATFGQLACASLTARRKRDKAVVVSGFVASDDDFSRLASAIREVEEVDDVLFSTEVLPPPFCNFLEVTAPLELRNQNQQLGTLVTLASGGTDLSQGDFLVVEATAPRFEGYSYLFYVQNDGTVIHLLPTDEIEKNRTNADERLVVGNSPDGPSYRVTGPFGRDLIVLVTAASPLFDGPRPQLEGAEDFARELAGRLAAAEAAGQQVTADHLFVQTTPLAN